jgi:hypothetical protein
MEDIHTTRLFAAPGVRSVIALLLPLLADPSNIEANARISCLEGPGGGYPLF